MGFKRTSDGRVFFQNINESGADATAPQTPLGQKQKPQPPAPKKAAATPPTANDSPAPTPKAAMRMRSEQGGGPSQAQIITLLKTLNDRLKTTQGERDKMMRELDNYRDHIETLEEKAERNERLTLDIESRLHAESTTQRQAPHGEDDETIQQTRAELTETRRMLAALAQKQNQQEKSLDEKLTKNATNYAALSRRLQDTETRQMDVSEKVENAITQQSKLIRKVDKAIEDRARFMRKIERIEETVIQTRDSLNAKAMVVLTDQAVAGENAAPASLSHQQQDSDDPVVAAMGRGNHGPIPAQGPRESAYREDSYESLYTPKDAIARSEEQRLKPLQIAAIFAGILLLGVVAAWGINSIKGQDSSDDAMEALSFNDDATSQSSLDSTLGEDWGADWQSPKTREETLEGTPASASVDVSVETAPPQDFSALNEPQAVEEMEWDVADVIAPADASAVTQQAVAEVDPTDDVGAINLENEDELVALIEGNPTRLAQELNSIEPQRINDAQSESDLIAAAIPDSIADIVVSPPAGGNSGLYSKTAVPQAAQTLETEIDELRSEQRLRTMISADNNLPNAVKTIEEQAFKGSREAQHDLAAIYTAGHNGVKQDYERAAFWFERAAENGVANAAYNLGVLHHQGLGTPQSLENALNWYKNAAAQGHPEAQYNLGIAYIEGIGVAYDPRIASEYFANAAQNGVMEAAYNLGLIYENGLLGRAQPQQALAWYKKAADQGSPEAMAALTELAKRLNVDINDINATQIPPPIKSSSSSVFVQEQGSAEDFTSSSAIDGQALIAQIQDYLMGSGLYPGPADGVSGALTEDAIRSYQSLHGMRADGVASSDLLAHMLSNAQGN